MKIKSSCCCKCFKHIVCDGVLGPHSSLMWVAICNSYHANKGPFGFKVEATEGTNDLLAHLEKLGYITTTEEQDYLVLKPNGFCHSDTIGQYFCINHQEHLNGRETL